ncbi:hypothetical protein K461DRAFT_325265 [Myriangium duriaei CBS 260.36]|uniref:Brl1/Brr6 domain-containing protein n=1 Tax=Myriangium duriaei CBS 260.36 TaxID=1168546 RepID=A0A9P4IPR7_9PEZI|nr:hypothetical protein K461DRAFT_325265 [Myriangium duriaei CBS 260.36]
MDRRTHEAPMDFEYQNGTGPIDVRSPFAQVSGNHQRSFASMEDNNTRKRGLRAAFGSPSKPSSPTKSFGSSTPFSLKQNPLFSTPRSMDIDMASSGGETPDQSSMMDSDVTPGAENNTFRSVPVNFSAKPTLFGNLSPSKASPTKVKGKNEEKIIEADKRRDSWWSRAAGLISSPGRGEVPRVIHTNDKLVKKVQKKRRGESVRQLIKLRSNSMSDSEVSQSPSPSKPKKRSRWSTKKDSPEPEPATMQQKGTLASWAEFLTAHPTLPQILSWYAQLAMNSFLIMGGIWILYSFYATVKSDVDKKSTEAVAELLAEMAVCARQYTENRCAPETRVPAMETVCTNWEKCMNRDTRALGRARISVGMWAEIFNSFIEPISWKAMIFTCLMIFSAIALSNLPFSMIRSRAEQAAANHHHYYGATGPVPPTPQRTISGSDQQFWTPSHRDLPGLEPAPSHGYSQFEGRRSPVKQLQF